MIGGSAGVRPIHIVQGEQAVSATAGDCLSTILGSCVAACLWDPQAGIGGMNHFLLPDAPYGASTDRRYGVQAMEMLINGLLTRGASRHGLRAKVFGGARMNAGMADIGAKNASFIRRFLADEEIPLVSESLGGVQARRVQFWPVTGRARINWVDGAAVALATPAGPDHPVPQTGELELF